MSGIGSPPSCAVSCVLAPPPAPPEVYAGTPPPFLTHVAQIPAVQATGSSIAAAAAAALCLQACGNLLEAWDAGQNSHDKRLMVASCVLQDFFDSEEGNRESFDYNKPTTSTANPLYGREGKSASPLANFQMPELNFRRWYFCKPARVRKWGVRLPEASQLAGFQHAPSYMFCI